MIKQFVADKECKLQFEFPTNEEGAITATAITWELQNKYNETLTNGVIDIPVKEEDEELPKYADIVIGAEFNNLLEDEELDFRAIIYTVTTQDGTYTEQDEYFIVAGDMDLTVMKNSYQTYGEAQITASTISTLQDWYDISRQEKISALINAYHKIGQLNFVVDCQEISDINSLTKEEFEALDSKFIEAIKRAQVVEADSVSGYNVATALQDNNILSYTIGETSQMFRSGNQYKTMLSSSAMDILSKYICRRIQIGRSS